jgi:hypothetical protein
VHAVLVDLLGPHRILVDPRARGGVQDRLQVGPAGAQDVREG